MFAEATAAPSAAPTAAPTVTPSFAPTAAPTVAPTLPVTDCRAACSLFTATNVSIVRGKHIADILVSDNFDFTFDVTATGNTIDGNTYGNIVDVVNKATGYPFIRIGITGTRYLRMSYKNTAHTPNGPLLASPDSGAFTTLQFSYLHGHASLWTSSAPNSREGADVGSVANNTDRIYSVYASGPYLNGLSAGEYLKNLVVRGEHLPRTFKYPYFTWRAYFWWLCDLLAM